MNSSFYTNLLLIFILVFLILVILRCTGRNHLRLVMRKYNFDKDTALIFIKRNLVLVTKYRCLTRDMSDQSPDLEARLQHLETSYRDEVDALVEELRAHNLPPDSE
jgi:hypothetical protein